MKGNHEHRRTTDAAGPRGDAPLVKAAGIAAVLRRAAAASRSLAIAGSGAAALALAACNAKAPGSGPVAARVNGQAITLDQVSDEIAALGLRVHGDSGKAPRHVLDRLIDRQLLAQEAAETGLDRDARVMRTIERARSRILVEAYASRSLEPPRPDAADIRRFYEAHPALFERRRVYAFRDFVIDRSAWTGALLASLDAARTRAGVEAVLKTTNVAFRELETVRGAEQLPLELLPRIAAMDRGEIAALRDGASVILMQLVDFAERPLALAQATPYIEQFLLNENRRRMTASLVEALRGMARIEYLVPLDERPADAAPESPSRDTAADADVPDPRPAPEPGGDARRLLTRK